MRGRKSITRSLEDWLALTKQKGTCLEWTRCLNTDGYPRATINKNSNIKVHRVVYELATGEKPNIVRHRCDNPKCLNPNHLVNGTVQDNVRDMDERNRRYRLRGI